MSVFHIIRELFLWSKSVFSCFSAPCQFFISSVSCSFQSNLFSSYCISPFQFSYHPWVVFFIQSHFLVILILTVCFHIIRESFASAKLIFNHFIDPCKFFKSSVSSSLRSKSFSSLLNAHRLFSILSVSCFLRSIQSHFSVPRQFLISSVSFFIQSN